MAPQSILPRLENLFLRNQVSQLWFDYSTLQNLLHNGCKPRTTPEIPVLLSRIKIQLEALTPKFSLPLLNEFSLKNVDSVLQQANACIETWGTKTRHGLVHQNDFKQKHILDFNPLNIAEIPTSVSLEHPIEFPTFSDITVSNADFLVYILHLCIIGDYPIYKPIWSLNSEIYQYNPENYTFSDLQKLSFFKGTEADFVLQLQMQLNTHLRSVSYFSTVTIQPPIKRTRGIITLTEPDLTHQILLY